jgi:hypothetical protein
MSLNGTVVLNGIAIFGGCPVRTRLPEHLATRDFSRESCQPSTRHCELRCARNVGFEPVSAAVFWIFRFRKANVPQLHNRTVACATALAAVTRSLRRTRSSGVGHSL